MTYTRRLGLGLTLAICLGLAHLAQADVRTDEKTRFQLGGMLGKVAGIFGGKDLSAEIPKLKRSALYCVTEVHEPDDIERLAQAIERAVKS